MKRTLIGMLCALTALGAVSPALAGTQQSDLKHAPEAMNLELETYRGTSVGGTLTATDPEGETVTYSLATEPMKGTVELHEDGSFVYTPNEGKRGKDYFGYKATDTQGNTSQEATVIIKIKKQKCAVTYADMTGRGEGYDAVCLAERGVLVGQCVAGQWLFQPEETVQRSEFLAMCLKLADKPVLQSVMATGFGDDQAIPAWAKRYVSTGRMTGTVMGSAEGRQIVFDASRPITHAEAAVMLNRMLEPEEVSFTASDAVPAWAAQAVANLTDCGVLSPEQTGSAPLTRAECAVMLMHTAELMH